MTGRRHSVASLTVTAVFSLLATCCAASTFWPTYQSTSFIIMVVATVIIGTAIGVVGAVFRLSAAIVALMAVAAYLLCGVALAVPDKAIVGVFPSVDGVLDLITGAALGWKQLVTISAPVGSYQALLVPVFFVVLLVSVVSVTVALRARRGEWALLVTIGLFGLGIALGPETVQAPALPALALVIVMLGWLVAFRIRRRGEASAALRRQSGAPIARSERRFTRLRSLVSAGIVLLVAVVAGTAAAAFVPAAGNRDVVRSALVQPFDPSVHASPLSGFRSYLEPPSSHEAMLTVSGLDGERRIRIATLDTYDGVVYSVGSGQGSSASGTFTRVPGRLDAAGLDGKNVSLDVTVDGYRGVWLPGVGALRAVEFTGSRAGQLRNAVYNNAVTGTTAVSAGLRAGDRYRLDATVGDTRTIAQLADASPGDAVMPKLDVVPDGIDQAIHDAAGSQRQSGKQLAAALKMLVDDGYISHGIGASEPISHSGHGAGRITQLLSDVPMVGDQEQYAVAAALMARRIGFPARVVVGFVVPKDAAAGGTVTVTGADISAWIQVQTKHDGWVTVDPNPPVRPIPQKQPQDPKKISRPQTNIQPPATKIQPDAAPPQQSRVVHTPNDATNPLLAMLLAIGRIVGVVVIVIAVVLAPFMAVVAAKWHRRRNRRNAPDPLERVSGGWQEFVDAALDHGFTPQPAATRSEVAQAVGGMRPLVLASVADRAAFAPSGPSETDADRVWQAVDELRRRMNNGATRWQRIRAAVSLASLGGYRRRGSKEGSTR
jgi:transglutaminase-like putative cysteine protease